MHRQVIADIQEQFPGLDTSDSTFTYRLGNCYVMAIRLDPEDSDRLRSLPIVEAQSGVVDLDHQGWLSARSLRALLSASIELTATEGSHPGIGAVLWGARDCGERRMINIDLSEQGPILVMFSPGRDAIAWILIDFPDGAGELAPGDYLFQIVGPD